VAYLSYEERRRSLIDAAVEVLVAEGLAKTTTRRVAEQAGAAIGTLHYCFRNKEELMQAVIEKGASTFGSAFEGIDPDEGVEATIRASVAAYWRWARDNPGLNMALQELLVWTIRTHERNDELYATVRAPFGGDVLGDNLARAAKADGITTAIPIDEVVRFICDHFDGIMYDFAVSGDEAASERQAEILADAMCVLALPGTPAKPARAPRKKAASRR
jgi:AcrR family transcriptional regulator